MSITPTTDLAFELSFPSHVHFGIGVLEQLPSRLERSVQSILLLHDNIDALAPSVARVKILLKPYCSQLQAIPLPDKGAHAESILLLSSTLKTPPDLIVALGGGAVIDTAKILSLALTHGEKWPEMRISGSLGQSAIGLITPLIAIPTLAGTGTEISPAALITRERRKELFVSERLCPHYAFVDPELACSAPPDVSVRTAIDALVQGVEAYVTPRANVFSDLLALEAIRRTAAGLKRVYDRPHDLGVRSELAYAALLGNLCIKLSGGVGAAHGLSNPLSARYGLHHGFTVGLLLPAVMRFNGPSKPEGVPHLAAALKVESLAENEHKLWEEVIHAVERLRASVGMAGSLRDFGILREDLARLGVEAAADLDTSGNPHLVRPEDATLLYESIW